MLKALRIVFITLLGLILSASGFYVAYLYIKGVNDNTSSPLLLLPSIVLVGLGIFLLLRAGKSNATIPSLVGVEEVPENKNKEGFESLLNRNNELSEEWSKTVDDRDKLQILQIAAKAEDEANKNKAAGTA